MTEKSKDYTEQWKTLVDQRESWIPIWKDIRDFILPQTGSFEDTDKPDEMTNRYDMILDGTATRSARILAAGIQGGLTSPSRPWFKLGLQDAYLEGLKTVKLWLEDCEEKMYGMFAATNFYNSIHTVYQEESVYGQGPLIIEEDATSTVRFQTLTAGEYCIAENERGIVDTLYRTLWMQTRQIIAKGWGNTEDQEIKNVLKEDRPFEWHRILHIIEPRENYDPNMKDRYNMPFKSVYVLLGGNNPILDESGYRGSPLAVPRWLASGQSPYGFAPGHDILGDVKMLQQMAGDQFEGLEKTVRPPLKAAGSLKQKISHLAGMVTYSADGVTSDSIKPIYQVNLNLADLTAAIRDTRNQIQAGLYNDLFLMLAAPTGNMTATEVAERHEEKLLMLGPVIERQFLELLNPVVDRTFEIMARHGKFLPPPKELLQAIQSGASNEIRVEYVSLLAQAQRMVQTQSLRAVTGFVINLAQAKPGALDKFDEDAAIDEFASATGCPTKVIRSDEDVAKIRNIRMQQQQAMAAQAQKAEALKAMKTLGDTNTEEGSALGDLSKSMGA